jgi:hypothetical protein
LQWPRAGDHDIGFVCRVCLQLARWTPNQVEPHDSHA